MVWLHGETGEQMKITSPMRRLGVRALVVATLIAGVQAIVPSSPANAATTGTFLSFTSDPGDYIGQGQTVTYTPATASFSSTQDGSNFSSRTNDPTYSFWWDLHLTAPVGQTLTVGSYNNATRWPFQVSSAPGLDFSGSGRGCNMSSGSFQVLDAAFAPNGYVERFHATFVQYCENGTAALHGEIQISNPPAPAPLTVNASAIGGAAVRTTGKAVVDGTMKCSAATSLQLSVVVSQRVNRTLVATGSGSATVQCGPTAGTWSITVPGNVPFNPGTAEVTVNGLAYDPNYGTPVSVQSTSTIKLSR
jgi:hypothetical protein